MGIIFTKSWHLLIINNKGFIDFLTKEQRGSCFSATLCFKEIER
jgi:hypothetical protein